MKKFVAFLLLMFAFVAGVNAQLLKTTAPVKDTCVNTDNTTIALGSIPGEAVAFHLSCNKVSGTVGGNVILQASIDGTNYVNLDTVALANVTYNLATFEPSKLSYGFYRIYVATSGTCKINTIRAHWLRRNK